MIATTLISFLIIGAATIWYTKDENDKYHRERLARKEKAIQTSLNYFLQGQEGDINSFYTKDFHDKVIELADIHQLELNFFDLEGRWFSSSNYEYFDLGLLPDTLSNSTLKELSTSGGRYILSKKLNGEDFFYSLRYIRNENGEPLAVVNIPYFTSDQINKEETEEFLLALAQVYALLLIAGLVVAYYLSNSITSNLSDITESINSISLSGENRELTWESDDEVGSLVSAYNEKVRELEKSAQQLARSEREIAWKEMAKQVAHEIKNPLTPMMLQVQQLERSWKDGREDFPVRLERFKETMTEQIETLSRIATEFSEFAKLPEAKNEIVDVQETIGKIASLFQGSNDYQLICEFPEKKCLVQMDKDHLSRAMNNLITNAIQAIPDNKKGEIEIELSCSFDGGVIISITDNGKGIPKSDLDRIFQPNFTTKSGGTGLGLAMVQRMIEQASGNISVVSKEDFGTTFILNLPAHKT